jgi:tetraacyldisaccharide 4'-kinase
MSLSERLLAAWYGGHPALVALRPLEWIYRFVVSSKRRRFLAGKGEIYRAPVPVLVVGNITVGGTGKTPMILWLVEYCRQKGLCVGVISRGYGSEPPSLPHRVKADQPVEHTGDEPLLIVHRTGVPMMIDPYRARAARTLLQQERLDLILSDDGLQHYGLARDLELVLVDSVRGLGNRRCIPAGPLREPVERLEDVDAVLCNGMSNDSEQTFGMTLEPSALVNLLTHERVPIEHFPPGQQVHAVAGIGNPQRFFRTLEALDWQPVTHAFPDHARFSAVSLSFDTPLPVIMTEKDAVKCRAFAKKDWWYLEVQAVPTQAFRTWFDAQLSRLLPGRF